jgi:type I restriction enzyme R subunit
MKMQKSIIVRDGSLTGFNAPNQHTLYIDTPMKGHNLMQRMTTETVLKQI